MAKVKKPIPYLKTMAELTNKEFVDEIMFNLKALKGSCLVSFEDDYMFYTVIIKTYTDVFLVFQYDKKNGETSKFFINKMLIDRLKELNGE